MTKLFTMWDAMEKALAKNDKVEVVFSRSNYGMSYSAIRIMEAINETVSE